jgi:hypothetical protein
MRLQVPNDAGPTLRRETKGVPTRAADRIDFNQTVDASPFFSTPENRLTRPAQFSIVSERSLIF